MGAFVRSDLWSKASGLWVAQLTQKAAVLGFSFMVGHRLGGDGVGVMASVLALAWLGGTVAGMGLPDRAVFRGASGVMSGENRRLYGSFLLLVLLVHGAMWWLAGEMAGTVEPHLVAFARGLIAGAWAHCSSAVGLGWLRGAGRPKAEVWATAASAIALIAVPLLGFDLGLAWAVSGLCMLVGAVVGNRREGLVPDRPALPLDVLRRGTPFLAYGLGAWLVGNMDVLFARAAHHPDDVGALQVGSMAVRGLGLVPWVAATLMLRPLAQDWARSIPPRPIRWAFRAACVGALVAALAWVVMPFLALGHGMTMESIHRTTWASMAVAPVLYAFVFLVPIAAQWHLGRTLKAMGIALMTSVAVGVISMDVVDVASKIVAAGIGQLVAVLWLINAFRSPRPEGIEVDGGALGPGVARTGDARGGAPLGED